MLNLNRLQVLQAVLAHGSFSGAAQSLAYTQSAVSQAIGRLEAEVGAQLIVRDRRGVRPTAAGASLAAHAETLLAQASAAEADLAAVLGLRTGALRLASFPSAGATLIPQAVARFRAAHPGVALSLSEGEPEEIAPRLRAGEVDLALLFEFPGAGRWARGLKPVRLLEDPMYVALPATHPLAAQEPLTLADLEGEEWVQTSPESPCARHVVHSCLEAGFEPRVSFETDDYETVQGLVAAGVGVALIPGLALQRVHPGIVVRDLAPRSPWRRVTAATAPGANTDPAARAMTDVLRQVASDYDAPAVTRAQGWAARPPTPR
jgi:DNA-binding transcriptional LysR family regulator